MANQKISARTLATPPLNGNEKIPIGVSGDKAITPNMLYNFVAVALIDDGGFWKTSGTTSLTGNVTIDGIGHSIITNADNHAMQTGNGLASMNIYEPSPGLEGSARLHSYSTSQGGAQDFFLDDSPTFTDTRTTPKGMTYAASGYVTDNQSLTDKQYVDGKVVGSFKYVEDLYTLTGAGTEASPYTYADNTAAIQAVIDTYTVAKLSASRYNVTTPILVRNTNGDTKTAAVLGTFAPVMYPDAEGEPMTGTRIKYTGTAFKIGTTDLINQPRPGRPRFTNMAMWGPGKSIVGTFTDYTGAAFLVDGAVDQPQWESIHISNAPFGFVGTGIWDAGTVRNVNIIGNRYPIWFDSTMLSGLYVGFEDVTIFDNQGPIVLGGGAGDITVGVKINNSTIGSNGYVDLSGESVASCNIWLACHNSIISNSYITNAGLSNLLQTRIAADGIIVSGDYNQIVGCVICGQNQTGSAGVRVKSGATGTVINSNFKMVNSYFPANYRDVIIESGAVNTVLFLYPGMTYSDAGTNTIIIDGSAGSKPYLYARVGSNQTIPNATSTKVAFNTVVVDDASGFNIGTNEYTIPSSGDYLITGGLTYDNTLVDASQIQCNIYINNSPSRVSILQTAGTNYLTCPINAVLRLSTGDKVTIVTYQDTGSNKTVLADNLATGIMIKKM